MPAKDMYHDQVRRSLENEGWRITNDPLRLFWGTRDFYVDLGAERLLAAEKESEKIAVEVKSFLGPSFIADLQQALGQYIIYADILSRLEPDRTLFLAVHDSIFHDVFDEPIAQLILENNRIKVLVFNPNSEEIMQWIE